MGMSRALVESRIDDIIEVSELGDFIDQPVNTYSSGMSARLGFSVALQADPDVLLVDEIMGVGDEAFRQKSTEALERRMNSSRTVVLISHNPALIRRLCDRAVWLEGGVAREEGTPAEVLQHYQAYLQSTTPITRAAARAAP